ncbi:40S ribosomal protein S5-1 [Hordeum vulgare]|nr:40S ribosomal protein S5-1 [Hordeum vulgare]
MTTPSSSKGKFLEKVINSYLSEVMKHPRAIEMHEGVLHIRDVQEPKKEGSEKARLATVEHKIFKCEGMVERGFSANHSMITDFIRENKLNTKNVGDALFKLQEPIKNLQAQSFDLRSQNCEYELMFKRMRTAVDFRVAETRFCFYDGDSMPWR